MRLDHIAYRVADRHKTAKFFIEVFGYKIDPELPEGFDVNLEDGKMAKCLVLLPPEKPIKYNSPWAIFDVYTYVGEFKGNFFKELLKFVVFGPNRIHTPYHMAPEIFISDSSEDTVIRRWVENRSGVGGIHHLAYQVENVEEMMSFMKEKGYAEFTSEKPLTCPGLTQVFTKPSELTGIIYEFIQREKQGFCRDNVKDLMNSTKDFK